jgi:hypothetical protein
MFCAGRFGGSKSFGEHEPSPSVHARASPALRRISHRAQGPAWVDDNSQSQCMNCRSPPSHCHGAFAVLRVTLVRARRRDFGLLVRRHHCRHCGLVFCGECTCDRRPLPRFEYRPAACFVLAL